MGRGRARWNSLALIALPLAAASACFVPGFQGDGRNDGGAGEGGAGGTPSVGGSSTGGDAGAGGSLGGSSTGGTSTGGTQPTLDKPCPESGDRACDASDSKLTLLCSQGTWESSGTCPSEEACEPTTGLCADIVPECAGGEPGDRFCTGDVVMECGPNLVSESVIEECEGHCVSGTSTASCAPPNCGDGYPDPDETCDDGDADNNDDCTQLCEPPDCGDGFVQAGEACDQGANNDDEGSCMEACTLPTCGDAFVQPGEDCDEGAENGDHAVGGITCPIDCNIRVTQVVAGEQFSCALHSSGAVKCWGRNHNGQLGVGDLDSRGDQAGEMGNDLLPIDLSSSAFATALVVGNAHACALLNDDSVKCWGWNEFGTLGVGDPASRGDMPGEMGDSLPAIDLGDGVSATTLTPGAGHTCALLDDDSVKCWGFNNRGQLGLGDQDHRGDAPSEMGENLPRVDLGLGRSAKALAAGYAHTCAVLDDDSLKCWGLNNRGQLGLGDGVYRGDEPLEMGDSLTAIDLGTDRYAKAVVAGYEHTCALLDDDSVKCWGYNFYGQLGLGDQFNRGDGPGEMGDNLPTVDLGLGRSAKALQGGAFHTCALLDDDSIKCWGSNDSGDLGLGSTAPRGDAVGEMGDSLPTVDLGPGRYATALSAGHFYNCALLDDDSVKCWGQGSYGQLGLGDPDNRGDGPGEMGDNLPPVDLW